MNDPETIPPRIDLVPVRDFSSTEMLDVAQTLNGLVNNHVNQEELRARGRIATIGRYGRTVEEAYDNLQMIAPQTELTGFVVMNKGVTPIGMATLMDGLSLEVQKYPLPKKLMKVLGLQETISELPRTNVSGWVAFVEGINLGLVAANSAVYSDLREKAPNSWTIEPERQGTQHIRSAILEAGYGSVYVDAKRYDEHDKLPFPGIPPKSRLYVSGF